MSIRTHTCFTVACDGCATTPEGDEGELHYSSADEAERWLAGGTDPQQSWEVDGDRHLCPRCLCERDGHRWDEPRRCRCDGRIGLPGHSEDCAVWSRWCDRCVTGSENVDPPESGGAR